MEALLILAVLVAVALVGAAAQSFGVDSRDLENSIDLETR
jgi:hypothetical protein